MVLAESRRNVHWLPAQCISIDVFSVAQLCPTLCDRMDCSQPDSSVHGISQARMLEWVAISFSRGSSQPGDRTHVSCISYTGIHTYLCIHVL